MPCTDSVVKLSFLWITSAGSHEIRYSLGMEELPEDSGGVPEVPGYDVGRRLGRGGSATVWHVIERSTGHEYALKCFDRPFGEDGTEEGMRRELRILSVLEHEHLVRAHAVVRWPDGDGGLGLLLDYAPGGTLAELLAARGRLGAGEAVTVLTPVAQVLAYLHTRGFAHGDVSPGNVLFTAHGKPMLADLGVARMVADVVGPAEAGTAGFRDPVPTDGARAGLQPERDVYSVAALGWFCLTGSAPGPTRLRPPLSLAVPDVPPDLAAALEAGLSEDRQERPSAAVLAAAIYRSAPADPVDLSVSVHPEVIPRLLTRRSLPVSAGERRIARLHGWFRSLRPGRGAGNATDRPVPARPAHPPVGRHALPGAASSAGARSGLRRRPRTAATVMALAGVVVAGLAGAWWILGGKSGQLVVVPGLPGHTAPAPSFPPPADTGGTPRRPAPTILAVPEQVPETTAAEAQNTEPAAARASVPAELRDLLCAADPAAAARGLAGLRSLAFSSGDLRLLDEVNAPASGAAAADAPISTRLAETGHRLHGFSTTLTRAFESPGSDPARALLAVTAVTTPYQELNAAGTVVAEWPAGDEVRMRLALIRVHGAWRISEILADEPLTGEPSPGDPLTDSLTGEPGG